MSGKGIFNITKISSVKFGDCDELLNLVTFRYCLKMHPACNTVLSSHGATLTRDGGWYYVGTTKVAAALGALNSIWTFMSNRSLCQLHLKDVWMVSALYSVCAVYL